MNETHATSPSTGVSEAMPPQAPQATDIASLSDSLGTDVAAGLSDDEAAERLIAGGRNELTAPRPPSLIRRFLGQFRSLLILVLVGAAALSAVVGELKDALVVAGVLLLNAVLGTVQEARAENSVRALQGMLPPRARVRREGRIRDLTAGELVAGDVVLLEAGDRVPVDGRVIDAAGLTTDESSLTGETTPSTKQVDASLPVDVAVGDQSTMTWMTTTVVRGRGELLVTATGMSTRIGQVARMLWETEERRTPLQRQIDQLGRRLAMVAGVAVAAVFAVAMIRGDTLAQAALDAIALAIAAIPEGLPAVVTVTLALGTAAMARQRAIVKRLSSVETLGSTQVIWTGKTGTLTRNQMTVRVFVWQGRRHEVTGEGYGATDEIAPPANGWDAALEAMVLCNEADLRDDTVVGDPTKGAPDVVLQYCTQESTPTGNSPLTSTAALHDAVTELGDEGLRTLAIATRHLPDLPPEDVADAGDLLNELTFEVPVGIVDPPRPGVVDAIALAHQAGIRIMMVTGDHPATAASIAREVGIPGDVLTGADLDHLDDDELAERIGRLGVCARVAPDHKVRLVTSLQSAGLTTAMTGDGVNDAAALKRADIGVAMGSAGTEVTKEAGDLVLADDNFATIIAIRRHRSSIPPASAGCCCRGSSWPRGR